MNNMELMLKMKPLTKKQLELLKDCKEREMQDAPPISTYYTQSSKGLVTRGLLEARPFLKNGKKMMAFFLTSLGFQLLQRV